MQLKKIVPLALVAALTSTAAAGAAHLPQAGANRPSGVYSYVYESGFRQELLDKYFTLICGQFPGNKPEQTPEEQPDVEQPEETPEQIPEEEQPEQNPDAELPEQAPDNMPQLPDDNRPEQTPEETPDTAPEQTPEEDNGSMQGDYASQVVALVNAERAKYGLSALKVDSRVQQAAQVRAAETVRSFSHTRPNGSSFSTALTEAGVSYIRSGENIAYGQSTPQQVVNAWMNSSGHRANILNESFTTIGVGYTVSGGTAYWAQLFTA